MGGGHGEGAFYFGGGTMAPGSLGNETAVCVGALGNETAVCVGALGNENAVCVGALGNENAYVSFLYSRSLLTL